MKYIPVFLLIISLFLTAFSPPLPAQESQYSDPGGGFSLIYPDYLSIMDTKNQNSLTLISKEKAFIVAIGYAEAKDLPGDNIQKLCKQYPFVELLCINKIKETGFTPSPKSEVSFKGIPALKYILEKTSNNIVFSGDSLWFINKKKLYFIMFSGKKEDYDKNVDIFNTIMANLQL